MPRRRPLLSAALAALPAAALGLAGCQRPAATPSRSVVFFTADSAALGDDARATVAGAAAAARANPGARVTVLGFTGPAGSPGYNQALSDARARHVADLLASGGVDRSRIAIQPRGPVAFELIPTESRRVEIVVGG